MEILGIDIGGSGIKGAIVDIKSGTLISDRHRIPTPKPSKPEPMAEVVKAIVDHFNWKGVVGCAFPTVVVNGKAKTRGNIDQSWIGVQINELLSNTCEGLPFFVANDADLAGLAEMTYGIGKEKEGLVILVTIGTGLGTGVFYNGQLVPNIELGRIFHTNGEYIEFYAADSARKREALKLKDWAERFDFFLNYIDRTFSPNHFIIGGGLSKKFDKFKEHLTVDVPIEVAHFKNNAGIIGAAMYGYQMNKK